MRNSHEPEAQGTTPTVAHTARASRGRRPSCRNPSGLTNSTAPIAGARAQLADSPPAPTHTPRALAAPHARALANWGGGGDGFAFGGLGSHRPGGPAAWRPRPARDAPALRAGPRPDERGALKAARPSSDGAGSPEARWWAGRLPLSRARVRASGCGAPASCGPARAEPPPPRLACRRWRSQRHRAECNPKSPVCKCDIEVVGDMFGGRRKTVGGTRAPPASAAPRGGTARGEATAPRLSHRRRTKGLSYCVRTGMQAERSPSPRPVVLADSAEVRE